MTGGLKAESVRLRVASDRLTGILDSIETVVGRLALGVEAWVPLESGYEFGYARFVEARGGVRWRFAVRSARGVEPLQMSARRLRALSVPCLPLLFEAMEREAVALVAAIRSATAMAQEMADAIRLELERPR